MTEPLEPRQHLAATLALAEFEPNATRARATIVDLRKKSSASVTGSAVGRSDRDTFRIRVAVGARLALSTQNLGGASVKFRLTDAAGTLLASGSKRGSVFVDGGQSYFLSVQSKAAATADYRVTISVASSEVPAKRLDLLRKGVNLPGWFWNNVGDERNAMKRFIEADDVTLIKRLGFGHVRLPVDMKYFFNPDSPFKLSSTYLGELDAAISLLQSRGLGVIVCPFGDHQNWLVENEDLRSDAMAFSWTLARYLSKYDADLTFFQTTNEPAGTGWQWQRVQAQLVSTLREAAPRNTIITATPLLFGNDEFGTVGALWELSPYRDTNVVYGLHFYEPFVFTHQGAQWAIPGMEYLGGLAYPANVDQTEAIAADLRPRFTGTRFEPVIDLVRYYGYDGWGREKVQSKLGSAAQWAKQHRVPMILDEFGVYGLSVDAASRFKYLSDVRSFAEASIMGWAMWDFNSEFGVVDDGDGGAIRYDVLAALNLTLRQ